MVDFISIDAVPFKNGFKIGVMSPRTEELNELFAGRDGTLQLEPKKFTLSTGFQNYADQLFDFEFTEKDVILYTFPKSGTTWSQEVIWTIMHNSNLDNPAALDPLTDRSPNFDVHSVFSHVPPPVLVKNDTVDPNFYHTKGRLALDDTNMAPRPRIIKAHLPLSLLGPNINKAKIVCILRDPRDVCISYFHHCRVFYYHYFNGTFDQFVDAFLEDAVVWGPYWEHVNEAWERRNQDNVYIAYYENLKKSPLVEYRKLATFLGKDLADEQIENIVQYTSFGEMKKRDNHVLSIADRPFYMDSDRANDMGGFFRQGTSGGWKKVLTQEQKDKFDTWIQKNCPDQQIMRNILGE